MQPLTRHAELDAFCTELKGRLADDPRLALDTEFIRERTYEPVLELVQVSTSDGLIALLDIPALGDLGALGPLLTDPEILKIFHAGGQDIEILTSLLGEMPTPFFDTQIAAAFAGYGTQVGYGALVQSVLKVRLSKEEGFSDWSRRPLTASMCSYAADDVRYLHMLHDRLMARLQRRGRTEWAQEQTVRVLTNASETTQPEDLWKKVGSKQGLNRRELAILQELALWRDDEARRRNKPRRTILKDEPLVELAKRKPKTATAVLELRAVKGVGTRQAEELVLAIQRGMEIPESGWPVVESSPPLDEHGAALLELLSAVVKVRAMEEDLPPSLLAPSDALRQLAIQRTPEIVASLFTGWRGELLSTALEATLAGTLSVVWDPQLGHLACRTDSIT
ncbi:ribonuclease D [Armatimonas sp.]|uniref:ribonuclease D n=1 Tax=Armatimonas sp. TaxID=1872638 RepID=UPI003751E84E